MLIQINKIVRELLFKNSASNPLNQQTEFVSFIIFPYGETILINSFHIIDIITFPILKYSKIKCVLYTQKITTYYNIIFKILHFNIP